MSFGHKDIKNRKMWKIFSGECGNLKPMIVGEEGLYWILSDPKHKGGTTPAQPIKRTKQTLPH